MVSRLSAGRNLSPDPVRSTSFFFDGTSDDADEFSYQRTLASIAAHAIPVDRACNKLYLATYYSDNVYFFW